MPTVLEERIFDRLRAVDEEAAKQPALLLDHPLPPTVSANEHESRGRLHEGGSTSFTMMSPLNGHRFIHADHNRLVGI